MSNIPFTASRESSEFEFVSGNKDEVTKISANVKPAAVVVDEKVVEEEGLFGWVRGTGGILSKVAEKTVSNLITTLDPQMKGKPFFLKAFAIIMGLYSGTKYPKSESTEKWV